MNRFKRELMKRNHVSTFDGYPQILQGKSPYEPGYISLENVCVKTETAEWWTIYNVIIIHYQMLRNGEVREIDDDPPFF